MNFGNLGIYRRRVAKVMLLAGVGALTLPAWIRVQNVSAAQAAAPAAVQDHPEFPQGQGRETTLKLCSQCHSANIILANGQNQQGWEDTISKMVRFGLKGSDEDFTDVDDYLTKNFPATTVKKIFVNKATDQEFATTLGVSLDQGKAIVAYRDEVKGFNSLDDLKKTPGIDAAKVDAAKDKLIFGEFKSKPS